MDLNKKFLDLKNKVDFNENDRDINIKKESISKRLEKDFNLGGSFFVGSLGRGTAIKGSDADLLCYFPQSVFDRFNNYQSNGQSSLLQELKTSLSITYPNTSLKGDGQIISVVFYDSTIVEVLPTFVRNNYLIHPDSNNGGSWKETRPLSEAKAMIDLNVKTNGLLYTLCKTLRVWKEFNNVKIKGAILDCMSYKFLSTYSNELELFNACNSLMFCRFFRTMKISASELFHYMPGSNTIIYNYNNPKRDFEMADKKMSVIFEKDISNQYYNPENDLINLLGYKIKGI